MPTIKPATFAWLAAATLTASPAFAQDATPPPPLAPPPAAPAAPAPPAPPAAPTVLPTHRVQRPPDGPERGRPPHDGPQDDEHPHGPRREAMPPMMERRHREPVTFLGVGVEPVPPVLVDQLNLPEGFGLMASYVVPGSPAEKAGVKPHDILKTINDQMLVSPDQLATLVRSFSEGQEVSLTILHKGQEAKLSVKLEKQVPPPMGGPGMDQPRPRRMPFNFNGPRGHENEDDDMDSNFDEGGPGAEHGRRENAGGPPPPPAPPVREILRELRPEIREIMREARQSAEQLRAGASDVAKKDDDVREAHRNAEQLRKEITILRERDGASRTTRLDLGQARIVVRDDSGELTLKVDHGKRTLLAKDPEGKVLFSGPVNTDDEREAVPSDVRARLEKLEREQMPDLPPSSTPKPTSKQDGAHGPEVPFVR